MDREHSVRISEFSKDTVEDSHKHSTSSRYTQIEGDDAQDGRWEMSEVEKMRCDSNFCPSVSSDGDLFHPNPSILSNQTTPNTPQQRVNGQRPAQHSSV
jgi:hypothetical protein